MRRWLRPGVAILWWAALTVSVAADCQPIMQPDAEYIGATAQCSLGRPQTTTRICTGSDGSEQAMFSNTLSVREIDVNWISWSAPPDSERPNPIVAYNSSTTLTITLTNPAAIAGLEIENNQLDPAYPLTVSFQDTDSRQVATVTRSVRGDSGARLFAVACDDRVIRKLVIRAQGGAQGFAIAQMRSDGTGK